MDRGFKFIGVYANLNSQDGIQATEADTAIDYGINSSTKRNTHDLITMITIRINGVLSMQTPTHEILRGFGFVPVQVRTILSIGYNQILLK